MQKNTYLLKYIDSLSDKKEVKKILLETIGFISSKQEHEKRLVPWIIENKEKIEHIVDWIESIILNNEQWRTPRVLTVEALNNAADKYFEKNNNKIQTIELNEKDEKLIADLDNYYVIQMLTPESLDNESKQMQHCIGHGGYDRYLDDDKYQYLSLRDKFNKAHVTIEIKDKKIYQLQGKQNQLPETKYLEKLLPWLMESQYEGIPWESIGKYYENGQWIKFIDIKLEKNIDFKIIDVIENCELIEPLTQRAYELLHLVNKERKMDYLFINSKTKEIIKENKNSNEINFLSKEILQSSRRVVKYLGKNGYKNIPYYKYNAYYNKNDGEIYTEENLPDNCEIDGNMILNFLGTKKIPKNLVINGNFNSGFSSVSIIEEGLKVSGDAFFSGDTKRLSEGIFIGGSLDLSWNYNIRELPSNLIVGKSLDLSGTNIKKIQKDIKIGKSLILENSQIEELPEDFLINKNLYLINCPRIKELPNNLVVNGDIFLIDSAIKKIPDNFVCKGSIHIEKKQIKLFRNIMYFNMISVKDIGVYTKEEFFEKYKLQDKKNCNLL